MQMRFVRATGLSHSLLTQIQRTREVVDQLRSGANIHDVVFQLQFYDQAHLYRNLKRFVGVTAREVMDAHWVGSLLEVRP
jgi:methylphosphotriester-DNA--protein-cysteine methyltransferase